MTKRLVAMGQEKYRGGFSVVEHKSELDRPLTWRKPRRVFVCSMSDLFHEDVSDKFIGNVFWIMGKAKQHQFQVLTKRAGRLIWWSERSASAPYPFSSNVWIGVSVEDQKQASRITALHRLAASVRFISAEPLLGPLDLRMHIGHLQWMIVGGESGPNFRPMEPEWARSIRDQCREAGVPFFMKQMAGKAPIPDDLMIREWPK